MTNGSRRFQIALPGLALVALLTISVSVGKARPQQTATATSSFLYLPVALQKFDTGLGTPLFGVQMYGSTGAGSKYHQSLRDSGASWVRVAVSWSNIEPTNVAPALYNWTSDAALAAARGDMGGLNVIATIDYNPAWAADHIRGPIRPANLPDFQEFVGALVERYDGDGLDDAPGSPRVDYWEFYNEPDWGSTGMEITWGDAGAEYAQMLQTVYPAVKAASPNAKVVFGGIAYDWFEDQGGPFVREFLDDVLSAGGGAYFDVMNFHTYPAFYLNWTTQGPGLLEKAQAVRDKLGEYGYYDKPMIVTEAGWHRNSEHVIPSNPDIQARYVVALFTQSMAADLHMMIWWMLYDPVFQLDFGLVTSDNPPARVLSFYAFQTIAAELSMVYFDRRLTVAETGASEMEAYKFDDRVNQRDVYVAWLDPLESDNTRLLRLPAAQATQRDIYGNSQLVNDADDGMIDGWVTLWIKGQPSYIEIAR